MPDPPLILPVENQVRELDAKLLLACVAAQSGYRSIIGWKGLIDARIGRFPPAVYMAKSMSRHNLKMLRIKRKLGHRVAAWDEEALVHYPQLIYYARRIGAQSIDLIDMFIAWGEDNRELLARHPAFNGGPIHVLGNPRSDLLRPEFRGFYAEEVARLKRVHGDFILINTNFGSVNGYSPELNLVQRAAGDPEQWVLGRGAIGMPAEYARGLYQHRARVLREFQQLLKAIARAYPERRVILRPHPGEDHDVWRRCCAGYANVEVHADGNVIPWLLAADCLIHNGCTTAIEAYLLGTRVISFVPLNDDRYEFELPNELGDTAKTAADVVALIGTELDAASAARTDCAKHELVSRYICSLEGEFATHKIIAAVSEHLLGDGERPPATTRFAGLARAELRAAQKCLQSWTGVARYNRAFMRQRFPRLTVADVQDKVDRLNDLIDGNRPVRVSLRETDLFETRAD